MRSAASTPGGSGDIAFGLLGAGLVACAFAFSVWGVPPVPPAPMVALGIASPLTGMTRSFVATAQGDLAGAFGLHPLGPLCFAACVVAAYSAVALLSAGRRPALVERIVGWRPGVWLVATMFVLAWIRQIAVQP